MKWFMKIFEKILCNEPKQQDKEDDNLILEAVVRQLHPLIDPYLNLSQESPEICLKKILVLKDWCKTVENRQFQKCYKKMLDHYETNCRLIIERRLKTKETNIQEYERFQQNQFKVAELEKALPKLPDFED